MDNTAQILQAAAPRTIAAARTSFPRRDACIPRRRTGGTRCSTSCCPIASPTGGEHTTAAQSGQRRRPAAGVRGRQRPSVWHWDLWRQSGEGRFQGGTLAGISSQLPYLANLGVTTLWIAPVFRQRVEGNDFHGYGVQDFFEVDRRFGTRADLAALVSAAHALGMRVVLDIIFNHTGSNWLYDAAETGDALRPKYTTGQYQRLFPANGLGGVITNPNQPLGKDDYVWPQDLQFIENYTRAGTGSLGNGDPRPERRAQADRFRGAARSGRRARRDARAVDLHLPVLDRPHRLRRAADRHAQARRAARRGAISAAP